MRSPPSCRIWSWPPRATPWPSPTSCATWPPRPRASTASRCPEPMPKTTGSSEMTAPPIHAIAVLGAGTMGRGIAHVAALAGFATSLYDPDPGALAKAEAAIHRSLAKGVELKKVTAEAAAKAQGALQLASQLPDAVAAADLVIES